MPAKDAGPRDSGKREDDMLDSTRHAAFRALRLWGLVIALTLAASTAQAQGKKFDLDENFPLRVEDELTTPPGGFTFQGAFIYEHGEDGADLFELEPALKYGLMERMEVEVASPFLLGDADDRGSGDVTASLQYTLNENARWVPAVSLKGSLAFPTGERSEGFDPTLKIIASWGLGPDQRHRVHANTAWTRNFEPLADERDNGWLYLLGYSYRLNDKWLVLADIWREEALLTDEEINLAEAGLIYEVNDRLSLAAGAGGGFGDESSEVRASTAFQLNF